MTGNLHRYSIRITPEANLEGDYSASICVTEMANNIPCNEELHKSVRPGGIAPLLKRLGFPAQDVIATMSRFGHEQAITLTESIDPEVLKNEGFEPG